MITTSIGKNPPKRVRDINWHDRKFIRAGIIPIINQGGIRFFGFGVENGVAAIGDFGGHREKIDKDALDTAIREYSEEALNIFGEFTREMLQNCHVIEGIDTVEILVPITGSLYQYTEAFRSLLVTLENNINHEVQDIVWLSRRQLLTAIDSQEISFDGVKIYHMYTRIRDTIHLNRDFL
jgi:hypothetical protein